MTTPKDTRQQSGVRFGLNVATAVVGGLALTFSLGSTALAFSTKTFFNPGEAHESAQSGETSSAGEAASTGEAIDFSDISEIEVDAERPGTINVSFDDSIDQAHFTVRDRNGQDANHLWQVRTKDQTLRISSEGPQVESWLNFNDLFGDRSSEYTADLVLPGEYNDDTLKLDLSGSALLAQVDGNFKSVDSDIGAGKFIFNGHAEKFESEVGAGELKATLTDVKQLDVDVATGQATVELTGTTPDSVKVEVSVGAADITLPKDSYNVTSEASLGSVKNNLKSSASSPHTVNAEVATGQITLNEK